MEPKDFDNVDFTRFVEPQLLANFDSIKGVLDNEEPFGVIIDGTPGKAKTTNADVLARCIQPSFNEEFQHGQGVDNFIKAYNYTADYAKGKYKVCIYDEANESDKGNSLGRLQKVLNHVLVSTARQERIIIFVILHRFYRLDEKFVDNSIIHMLINLYDKKQNKYTRFKAYDIDCMLHMLWSISRRKVNKKPKVYSLCSPNFGGSIRAPPKEYIDMVKAFSKRGKDAIRKKATRDMLASQYYTIPVLASMLEVTKNRVAAMIDKHDLRKDYLKEKSGRVFYYDKELFAVLKQLFQAVEDRKSLFKEL